jgi:hypothetical protein
MTEYELTIEKRVDYLYAYITGLSSYENSMQYWGKIADELHRQGLKKVLVHKNLTGSLSAAEIYDIVTRFAEAGFLGIHVAFYDENEGDADLNALGELIATNRGAFVKVFTSLEEAEAWIKPIKTSSSTK